ncbi:hypothetical protein BJX61DRAFT_540522 [Aspergillus egyptiacus]|nr:hypothetical protein BJX61DRAFT_540522 [Aspergillus egyptiacus]
MGNRKLAGSVRRYLATGLSRVKRTLSIARASHSSEQSKSANPVPVSEVTGSSPGLCEALPITKVPALDTLDRYVVDKPVQEDVVGRSARIALSCSSPAPTVIDGLVQGYARFVSSFTGLDEIAFVTTRRTPFVDSPSSRSIIVASATRENDGIKFNVREVDPRYHNQDEVQFYAVLGSGVEPENGEHSSSRGGDNAFTLLVVPSTTKQLLLSFKYPKRLIPEAVVDQLLKTLALHIVESSTLTMAAASEPDMSILNFPPSLIPPTLQHGGVDDSIPGSHLLHAAFEGWVREKPHAVALDFIQSLQSQTAPAEHCILTYAALDAAASNLAVHIRSLLSSSKFAGNGRIIPVYMPTSPELYISYLGVLKAGHAFCPIPQDAPAPRIQEILRDIDSPIILGNTPEPFIMSQRSGGTLHESTPIWVNVKEVSKRKELQGDSNIDLASRPSLDHVSIDHDQTAYLLFTSGSTGKPKGVQVSHLAGTCSIASHATAIPLPGIGVGDFRWFQFASPSFDPSLMEIFVTFSSGATLCSADRSLTMANLEETINEARATVMMATPSLASLLRPDRLITLEALWSMGEKLNRTVIDNFARKPTRNGDSSSIRPPKMLVNAYGPTEGAINCTYVAPFEEYMRGSIIGKALPTCSMFVLCPHTLSPKPVPTGTVGELAIGGPQVSKGYLNRPDETAASFVHSEELGSIYRTGDKARIVWDKSGTQVLEYLGRISTDQVKVNGRRVELGEIESVIAPVPGVSEAVAVVLTRDGQSEGNQQIVACIVAKEATKEEKERIVQQAQRNAARHLLPSTSPSAYRFVDSLPRSSSGKVDRKAVTDLLQKDSSDTKQANGHPVCTIGEWERPDNHQSLSLQELVIQLIAEATNEDVSDVKPGTGLYTLGLDSLGAMRLLQRLQDNGINGLSVSEVLQCHTSQALVSLVRDHHTQQGSNSNHAQKSAEIMEIFQSSVASFSERNHKLCAERLDIDPNTIERVLPTTAVQSGMLTSFLRSVKDDSYAKRTYIYHSVIHLEPGVELERLENAWEKVIDNYDSFRTVFCLVGDNELAPFAQCILSSKSVHKKEWARYALTTGTILQKDMLDHALRQAEESITLALPPWKLSLVELSDRPILILSMFHGIFDGSSLQLLLEDVSSAYYGRPLGTRTSLEHIVRHHFQADYAATSRFWDEYLRGHSPAVFPSVTPYRTPTKKSTGCVEVTSGLDHEYLKRYSRRLGATPLSVLQAAWCAILLSYTGTPDQDVVMGSVVSGRLDQDTLTCIGPTFTITPLRISLQELGKHTNKALTNKSIVRHLTASNAKALSHLQPRLGSVTAAGGKKLPYDTVLAFQEFGSGPGDSQLWSSIQHPPMANDFSVMVEVVPELDSSLTLRASFDTKLDRASAELMLKQMDDVVRYILEHPGGSFEDALMHTRSDLKSAFNPDPVVAPEVKDGALLHSQFEEHAATNPDSPALIFKRDLDIDEDPGNITWTYGELNAMADNLAEHIIEVCGDVADASMPICIEKSPALYVAILGILKAGGAWCPIDTLSPAQRRHDLIARTSAGILLVSDLDGTQPEGAVPAGVKLIDVDQFTRNVSTNSKRDSTKHRATPDNTAYLIWTSGTTGAPKGVPITHSAAVSSMRSLQKDIPGNTDGTPVRCLQFSQFTFDVSIQDLFYTWGLGGVLISGTREIMLESFPRLANITRATHAHLTPAFAAGVRRESCHTLNVITMIGEKLAQPVADDWGTNMRAFNTYGPAEVTVVSTIREFGNEHRSIKSANIGWPMDSVSVFVMKNQRVVMKNAIGELALGGPQLSPGYLNQQDKTDAKFVWNEEVGQRLYYTGDLVRMLSDGSLEYITRVDDLVKLGGIRIELSEISFSLRGCHPVVENIETMFLSRPDRPIQVIVAFLCAPKAAATDNAELLVLQPPALQIARAASIQARNMLPENMVPTVYLVVKSIPKTPSAKVDRRALEAAYASVDLDNWESDMNPEATASDPEGELDTSMAAQVIRIVASLVNIDPSAIARSNRLRSLGVDSLRATRLSFGLKEAGYGCSVVDVLGCATVQDLIKLALSSNSSNITTPQKFDVNAFDEVWHRSVAAKISDEFLTVRATAVQESLLTETMGSYKMYWSNHFFKLDPSVDLPRLRQAWFAVCQKSEALRTGFIPVAETRNERSTESLNFSMLQVIYRLPAVNWEYRKCTEQDWTEECKSRTEGIMTTNQKNYFRQPPWAVTVLEKGHERFLVFTVHHSIHDEPSLRFIMDDVRSAYSYKPPLRGQLSDALSIVLANENKYADTVGFWESELKNFRELDVPVWPDLTGKRIPPGVTPEYRLISEEIPMTKSIADLQSAAAKMGLRSVACIIRTAWAYVSLSYLGLPATVFAETLSDRVFDPSLENTVGPFISVVPVPFNPKGSVSEVLLEQHRLSVHSWRYRHIHARDVRKALSRPRGEPLYPAVFNFHGENYATEDPTLPNLWLQLEDQIGLHVEHPMAMNVFTDSNGALKLEASSDSRLFSPEHLRLFVRQIDGLITSMLASPHEQLSNLVNQLPSDLRSLSSRPVSEEVANSVYQAPTYWLEKYAGTHPNWTAVEVASSISADGIEKEAMSYAKLNAEANRVAAYLASFGYKNRIIGVCTGRTLPSYPIIIGIFKSGNTYLPIDESLPADRKAFLLEDGDSPIVFTEKSLIESFSSAPGSCRVECIDDPELQGSIARMSPDNCDYNSHPDDNSYLLFTSGSTGKPKGVMVTRANLSSFIESISEFACEIAPETLELGGTGRYLAQANRAFDPHLLEMFFPWRHGMATVTAPRPMILDDIGLTLSKWDITHASFVPSLVDQSNITPEQCPKLRFMTVGGEKITQKVLDTWASAPNVAIVNAYGPTEVTIGCTFAHINEFTNLRNIGPPLTACVGHVLVPGSMNYALRGQTGELCFSGDLVGKGYLNRPDAAGFVTGPDGVKMYRTGDIGRMMADDSIEYLGRGDDQTKIRGQRLELGEVSEMLRSSSPISLDVVTTVAKHPGLAKVQLLSFVSRSPRGKKVGDIAFLYSDFATLGRELQEICHKKLPGYMVPELILPVTSIPVAPMSGKANMKELHRLFSELPIQTVLQGNKTHAGDEAARQRPLNPEEEAVINEICHVISIDPSSFGPLTNIFEIGLDSLSAIGLSIRLRNIGYAATVALVMSNPIIEQLARLPKLSSSDTPAGASHLQQRIKEMEAQYRKVSTDIETSRVAAVRPCLPLQEGLVARSINSEDEQLYVNHVILQLGDTVDGEKLKVSWQLVTHDNEILRTAFVSLEKEIAQIVFSETSYAIQWTESEYNSLEEAIERRKSQPVQISREIISNISTTPPVRFHLAISSVDKRPVALFIAIHHALYDGESFSMMLEDVAAHYEGKPVSQRGSPSAFLEHVPTVLRSRLDAIRNTISLHRTLKAKLSELETRCANLQTTVPNLIQAVFALLLADFVGTSDVTYGLVLSGRAVSSPGAESVLLPCITTVPARLDTRNLTTVAEVVEVVQRSTVRSLDFQHTPLRKVQQWLKSDTPLFDCLFSYIRAASPPTHGLWKELDSHMSSEYPLALEVKADSSADTILVDCIFSPDFGSRHDSESFLGKMDTFLSDIISGETITLDSFNLAQSDTPGSRTSTLRDETEWSSTETRIRQLISAFCGLDTADIAKGASFLSLGIDSVTAIQFARRLRDDGFKASSSDIMRYSCVGALAQRIEEVSSTPQINGVKEVRGTLSVERYGKYVPLPNEGDSITSMFECTPLQSGMITQTISSGGKVYVNPHPLRLNSSVDVEKLKAAIEQVIQLNEILRTSFHLVDNIGWAGAVHLNPPSEWAEITLPSDANILSEVMSLRSFGEESSFRTPPLRTVLVVQPHSRTLVLVMHHALYDGASLPFVFEDLATIYSGVTPEKRPQFSEMVPYVFEGQNKSCEFWTNKLRSYEGAEILPLDISASSDSMLSREYRMDLDLETTTQACKDMEVTIQSVALLSYAKVYARLLGQRDIVVGQVLAGRALPHPEADRALGPLFNTVAQRVTFEPKFLSNRALAQRIQQQTNEAQVHQHAPLRVIQNTLRQSSQLRTAQLFDSLFVFQKSAALSGSVLHSQDIWTDYEDEDYVVDAEYKLNMEVDHRQDGIVVTVTCNGRYIDQNMLDRLMHDFDEAFRDIIEQPTRCSTALPEGLGALPLKQGPPKSPEPLSEQSEAPEQEALIHSVLAEVTGIPLEEIKPTTSIFNLGLDSLSAIRIASKCRGKGLKISVADILQGITLRGISRRVRMVPATEETSRVVLTRNYGSAEIEALQKLGLGRESIQDILPCLPGQFYHLTSWLKSRRTLLEPAWVFSSDERINPTKIEDAWFKLCQRHPVLRTVFASVSPSEIVQIVLKDAPDSSQTFKVIESPEDITSVAKEQALEEALHPSSLSSPPVRLRLLKASDKDGIMLIIHHALYDAWSMPMLVSELDALYQARALNSIPSFSSFVDVSTRSLAQLNQKAYWISSLKSGSPTFIRGSSSADARNPDQIFLGAWSKIQNLTRLESTSRAAGLSLQTIILLAVARYLAKATGVTSPLFGLYQTGRSASFPDIENLPGPCLNVTPFVVPNALSATTASASNGDKIIAQARNLQSALASRVPYEQSSLSNVLSWLSQDQTRSPQPLFNTWVNLLWTQTQIHSHLPSSHENPPGRDEKKTSLFTPLPIGVPTDFLPPGPLPEKSTPIDEIDTSFLHDENIFIDIAPDAESDSIGFGIRVEGGFLSYREIEGIVDGIVAEIEDVVEGVART